MSVPTGGEFLSTSPSSSSNSGYSSSPTTPRVDEEIPDSTSARSLRSLVRLQSVANKLGEPLTRPNAPRGDVDMTWLEERECIVLVLKARMMLRDMIEGRLHLERMEKGNLSVSEIQNLLKNQKEDVETDWIAGLLLFFYFFFISFSFYLYFFYLFFFICFVLQ